MRPLKNSCEIAIIGAGLAGLAAARHAARLGRLVTLFEGSGIFGGQVATVGHVQGLPFAGDFSGQDLAIPMLEDARKVGVRVVETGVKKVQVGQRLELTDADNNAYYPGAIIVASGASLKSLSVPGEASLLGRGVSRCATCDGSFFRGEDVVVVGGGDGAVHEALELAKSCQRVIMVCRSPLKARREYIDKLAARENVSFIWDSQVTEILGDESVRGVRLLNLKDGAVSEIKCSGVFPFVGVVPNSGFLPPSMLADNGYVAVSQGLLTSDSRVSAIGAVRANFGGTIIQAMAEGVTAAEAVARIF